MASSGQDQQPTSSKKRKLSESDNTQDEETIAKRKELFYNVDANGTFQFDKNAIKFNRGLLCWFADSPPLYEMLCGTLKQDVINIMDFGYDEFKLFLDCLIGFESVTKENAKIILPIAGKYLVTNILEKCAIALVPTEMNTEVCELLNMALFYNCRELCDVVVNFVQKYSSFYLLLDNDSYSSCLSLDSYKEVIHQVKMDDFIIKSILSWCDNYTKTVDSSVSIQTVAEKLKLKNLLKIEKFESGITLQEFIQTDIGKNFFTVDEICNYFNEINHSRCASKWLLMKQGEVFSEVYNNDFPMKFCQRGRNGRHQVNKVVMYTSPLKSKELPISCEIIFKNLDNNSAKICSVPANLNSKSKIFFNWPSEFIIKFYNCHHYNLKINYKFEKDCRIFVTNSPPREITTVITTAPRNSKDFFFTNRVVSPKHSSSNLNNIDFVDFFNFNIVTPREIELP